MINKKILLISLIIFCLALILRTYNLSNIYIFTFDEEYQATYAWTLVKHFHPIWIGVSASFLDYYMGPLFTYITAILLAVSHGDPVVTSYIAATVGAVTSVVIFLIGWKFFNTLTGFTAALLYATLPLFVFYDQKYWNPMFAPLITLLIFVTLNLIPKSKWWWIAVAGLVGLIFETELAPAPLILVGIWYFIRYGFWKNTRLVFFCLLTFLLLYWPLLIFDYNHNFSNITVLTRLSKQIHESQTTFNPINKFHSFFDSLGRFWYLKAGNSNADEINISCSSLSTKQEFKFIDKYTERTYTPIWLSTITLAGILLFLRFGLKNNKRSIRILTVFILVLLISFHIYPGGSFEYHNLGLFSLLTFIPGIFISQINARLRIIFSILLIFAIFLGFHTIVNASDKFGLGSKKMLIAKVMSIVGDKSFVIEGRGVCHNWEGWRYLFKVYGKATSQSYTDKSLGWLYPDEISKEKPAYTIILSEDRIPLKEDLSNLPSIRIGGYRAYIKKN